MGRALGAWAILSSLAVVGGACDAGKTAGGNGSGGQPATGGVHGDGGVQGGGGNATTSPTGATSGTVAAGTGGNGWGGSDVPVSGGSGGTRAAGGTGGGSPDAGCTGTLCAKDGSADAPASCSQLDSTACDLRRDCHAVYVDHRDCACTEKGCCVRFDHCADGATADCTSPATCNSVAPDCGDTYYTYAVENGCYVGCVRRFGGCAIPVCPSTPPADKSSCGRVDYPCLYEDCAGAGRTLAACVNGAWMVQSGMCSPIICTGVGVTPAEVTCVAGELCVLTGTSNVVPRVKPACVDNTCGKDPVSLQCIQPLAGRCAVDVLVDGTPVIDCEMPSPCEGAGGCSYAYP